MTRPLSSSTLETLLKSQFHKTCVLCGNRHVQFHHNLIFGGRQCDEPNTILPLCPNCHALEKRKDIKEKLNWIMYNRMTEEELLRYSKVDDLLSRRNLLNEKYKTN